MRFESLQQEQVHLVQAGSSGGGAALSGVSKQRLADLEGLVAAAAAALSQDKAQRKDARQMKATAEWRCEQLRKDMAHLEQAVDVLLDELRSFEAATDELEPVAIGRPRVCLCLYFQRASSGDFSSLIVSCFVGACGRTPVTCSQQRNTALVGDAVPSVQVCDPF